MTNKLCPFTCIHSFFVSICLAVIKIQSQPIKQSKSQSTKILNGLALTPKHAVRKSSKKDSNLSKSLQEIAVKTLSHFPRALQRVQLQMG